MKQPKMDKRFQDTHWTLANNGYDSERQVGFEGPYLLEVFAWPQKRERKSGHGMVLEAPWDGTNKPEESIATGGTQC